MTTLWRAFVAIDLIDESGQETYFVQNSGSEILSQSSIEQQLRGVVRDLM